MPERRDATAGSFYNGRSLPAWVRIVAFLVGTLGFSVTVSLYFLARDAGMIASPITETRAAVAGHVQNDEKILRFLRRICLNTAKTSADAERCDPPDRREGGPR